MTYLREDGTPIPCEDCGGPHMVDTSIPSPIWNAICRNPGAAGIGMPEVGLLCTACIDARLVKAGLTCDVAEFYYVGKALVCRLYAESTGTIDDLIRRMRRLVRFTEQLCEDMHVSKNYEALREARAVLPKVAAE